MIYCKYACLLIALFVSLGGFAQPVLKMPGNVQAAIDKGTRTTDGHPGNNYWQNRANYSLSVDFNPINLSLSGKADIQYFNNSPDTLTEIWFKLYPNLYQKGNLNGQRIKQADLTEGVNIKNIVVNGDERIPVRHVIDGTNMVVSTQAVLPGQTIFFSIDYSYVLNKGSHIRTGEIEPGADFVAYFFPRIAVYDDIDGWNKYPYTGVQEFYNDFCHFFASITVPAGYLVWATGDLKNSREIFNPPYVDRILAAGKSDGITTIIDSSELHSGNICSPGPHTWQFEAENVTDFVFATSNHYMWQASGLVTDSTDGRRTRVDAVFNPKHSNFFNVTGYARKTVETMSFVFPKWPFPYDHETVFDGLDQMEYPMMVNDNPLESKADDIELTDHEIFHTMFPFYMGINETKYGWMDEGWATLGEWLISPLIDTSIVDEYGMARYEKSAGTPNDMPIMTLTPDLSGIAMFTNSYPKPAMGYLFVKDLLGDELFYKALHYYIGTWRGKHPTPFDFFNCMNTGSGRNLNWFWQKWFFDDGAPDLAVTNLLNHGKEYAAVITLKGTKPVPVDLNIYFADGTKLYLHRTISCWENGHQAISIPFTSNKPVTKLVVGSVHVPDSDKSDNVYEVK